MELKDYRERKDFSSNFVAELEHFNPEYHPLLHALIDVPTWILKNRIFNKAPKLID